MADMDAASFQFEGDALPNAWEFDSDVLMDDAHNAPLLDDCFGLGEGRVGCETWSECGCINGIGLDKRGCPVHVVPVDPLTGEFALVVLPLLQTNVTIVSVDRVQNEHTWKRFRDCERHSTAHVNRWHGTAAADLRLLLTEGLDQRLSSARRAHFGNGIYVAESPAKAHRYTGRHKCMTLSCGSPAPVDGLVRTVLRCKVVLGRVKEYPKGVTDPGLFREPLGYDSVKGNVSGHDENVLYDNERVHIEYVVRYTVSDPPASPAATAADAAAIAGIARDLKSMTEQ